MNTLLVTLILSFWPFNEKIEDQVKKYHQEARHQSQKNIDSSYHILEEALRFSMESNYKFGIGKSHALLGSLRNIEGETSKATNHFLDALKVLSNEKDGKGLSLQANICLSLGKIYQLHHRLNEAIDFYDKGLEYSIDALDQGTYVNLLHNQAVVYRKVGDPKKSVEILSKKLDFVRQDNQTQQMIAYNQLGLANRDLGNNEAALEKFEKVLSMDTLNSSSRHRGQALHNMANIYLQQQNFVKAWSCFNQASDELESSVSPLDLFVTYQDMAHLALLQENYELALSYAEKATPLLTSAPKTPEYYDQYQLLSRCIRVFDPLKALAYADLHDQENATFIALQNELIALGEGYKMDLITTNYFNDQRQLQQKIRLYWTVSCGLIFFLVAGYLSIRVWRIYHYVSPKSSIDMIKNRNEFVYLFDLLRKEREETRITLRQLKDSER